LREKYVSREQEKEQKPFRPYFRCFSSGRNCGVLFWQKTGQVDNASQTAELDSYFNVNCRLYRRCLWRPMGLSEQSSPRKENSLDQALGKETQQCEP